MTILLVIPQVVRAEAAADRSRFNVQSSATQYAGEVGPGERQSG